MSSLENQNPKKWRYTWEAQSHLPLLKLFIFSSEINPITHCNQLNVELKFEKSLVIITWINNEEESPNSSSIFVPLPRVLVDLDSPLNFRVFDDHIQVKVPLLLPIDHPIVSKFISELNCGDDDSDAFASSDGFLAPLSMDSDFKELSAKGDIDFYCRNCAFKLTKRSVRCLVDLPSVNWTDVADNWFGTCCCSFGGISEKLVAKYVNSYRCVEGTCLLTAASVILYKNDIEGFKSPQTDMIKSGDNDNQWSTDIACNPTNEHLLSYDSSPKFGSVHYPTENKSINREFTEPVEDHREKPSCAATWVDSDTDPEPAHRCCEHDASDSSLKDLSISRSVVLQADQKSFLNCYLGNAFAFRTDTLSKDIEWIDFACPQCSCVLGAYPCNDGAVPLDGGIRLYKCCISISPPAELSDDLFSKYTLERMFTCQLLESAKDELSFRTVIKDLKTKSSILHIVLLNPNTWCCTGFCSGGTVESIVKINLHPVVKLLISNCYDELDTKPSISQHWETKNRAEEIYMSKHLTREVIKSLAEATSTFPPSFSTCEGFFLSSIPR